MKQVSTVIAFVVASPFIVAGAFWRFAADSFNAGVNLGQMFIDYLSE